MFILILIIPCVEVFQLLLMKFQTGTDFHPAFAFFLAGSSRGHLAQILLLWFLPLFFLLLGSDDVIQDYRTGYRDILISKVGRKKYCLQKYIVSFSVSFITMFFSLLVNFLLVSVFFANGTYTKGLSQIELPNNSLFTMSVAHPYLADLSFALIACIFAGFAGLIGASVSLFFLDKKYAYTAAFFIWFLLVLKENSLMFLFQPFAEYGFNVLIPILLLALAVFTIVPFIIFIYEVRYNES